MFVQAMTDNSRKTPPPPEGRRSVRQQSQDERDAESYAALKERELRAGLAAPEFTSEEITGRYEGDALAEQRERRPTPDRIKRLEKKHDELKIDVEKKHEELKSDVKEVRSDVRTVSGQVSDLRVEVGGAVGKLEGQENVLTEMLSIVKKSALDRADRDHVTFTAKLEVDKERELAKVEVDKEQQLDTFHARRARRRMIVKAVGIAASGAGVIELLHRLGVL